MIQTAREHEQSSKHKTKTRPTSAAPLVFRPDMNTSASHHDVLADDQASVDAVHAVNTANVYTLSCIYVECQARQPCMQCFIMALFGHYPVSGCVTTPFRSLPQRPSSFLINSEHNYQGGALHFTMHALTEAPAVSCSMQLTNLRSSLQGHQQLAPEHAAGSSQAVAPCAVPIWDCPCPGQQSARESVASPRVLNHSSSPAAAENLTSQTAVVLPADARQANCAPIMQKRVPSQGQQASTIFDRGGRPASAAASAGASSTLRPIRTFSTTLSKPKAAVQAVISQAGQHTQHGSLLPQDGLLQPPSNITDTAAGPNDGCFPQPVQQHAPQASVNSAQPELGPATMSRSTLRRPSKLTLLPIELNCQDGSLSPSTSRRSPKPTMLREQHMPGELLHQKSAFPSDILMRHEAACASPTTSQPDTPPAGTRPSSPSSTLQHRHSAAEAQMGQSGGRTLRPRSPKATLLRDQHLPGELLHQKTAFPSDIYMRHEAACALGLAKQPASDTDSALEAKQQSSTAVMRQQEQPPQQLVDVQVSRNTTTRIRISKNSSLTRAVSFAAAVVAAEADASTQAALTAGTGLPSVSKGLRATRMEDDSTLPLPRGTSKEAALDSLLLQSTDGDAMQAALPLKLHRKGSKGAGPQPKSSLKRGDSKLQQSSLQSNHQSGQQSIQKSSLKRADSRLQHSSEAAPTTPRSLAGPWFEATHHNLTHSKTWAREWLAMGAQDVNPTNPDFEQLQQQQQLSLHESDHQSLLPKEVPNAAQQPVQQQALQHLGRQQHSEQNTSQEQPKVQTPHQAWQHTTSELPSPGATARSQQHQALPPAALGRHADSAHTMQQHTSNGQLSQRQGRPQTAPEGFWSVAADAPWALDARRLHSARPGSGGSPTARYMSMSCCVAAYRLSDK